MKRFITVLLVISMVIGLVPVFAVTATETKSEVEIVDGLAMQSYVMKALTSNWNPGGYASIIGEDYNAELCDYAGNKKFDQSIQDLLDWSYQPEKHSQTGLTNFSQYDGGYVRDAFGSPNDNIYLLNWTGTVTATEDVTFTLVGHKVDNGFVFNMDGERYYEYWGASHWFDDDDHYLASDLGAITLKAGESHEVDIWFLELNGGEGLDIGAYVGDSTEYKSLADIGLTFDLNVEFWHSFHDQWGNADDQNHPYVQVFNTLEHKDGEGDNEGDYTGGNDAQCIPANFNYDATFDKLIAASVKVGTPIVVPTIHPWTASLSGESYINVYNGTFTVAETGYYLFGTAKVDNGLMIEITEGTTTTRVFELWANKTWNDKSQSWYPNAIRLEAGKTYTIDAAFMELDGGQVCEPKVKFADTAEACSAAEARNIADVLSFKTTLPESEQISTELAETVKADGTKIPVTDISTNKASGDIWGDGAPANAFDGRLDTKFGGNGTTVTLSWKADNSTVTHYSLTSATDDISFRRIPLGWTLLGSKDGKQYTVIDHVSVGEGGMGNMRQVSGTYAVDTPAEYSYYRLDVISSKTAGGVSLAEVELYNYVEPSYLNGVALKGFTANLGGEIGLNFHMELSEEILNDPSANVQFTVDWAHDPIPVANGTPSKDIEGAYIFTCRVPVKQINSDISVKVVSDSGESVTYVYSVADYASYIVNAEEGRYSAETKALANSMLHYGATAQIALNYKPGFLPDYTAPEITAPDLTAYKNSVINDGAAAIDYLGGSATLDSAIELNYYFAVKDGTEVTADTFKAIGKTVTVVDASMPEGVGEEYETGWSCYIVTVQNISAKDYNKYYTVEAAVGGETLTVGYSVYTYVAKAIESTGTENANAAIAAYHYSECAKAYFASKNA